MLWKLKKWRDNLMVGDKCYFYNEFEQLRRGKVLKVNDKEVEIKSFDTIKFTKRNYTIKKSQVFQYPI